MNEHKILTSKKHYTLQTEDLPLCCPLPCMPVWDQHPRVYISLKANETVACPYCGTTFSLSSTTDKHANV